MGYTIGEGYVTAEVKAYPLAAAGPTVLTAATVWGFGAWVEVMPADTVAVDFELAAVVSLIEPVALLGTRLEGLLEVGIGASGSETTIVQLPFDWYYGTAAGHCMEQYIPLTPPRKIPANSRIALRAAFTNSPTSPFTATFGGCKVHYVGALDTYTDELIKSYPAAAAGVQPVSSATLWTFGSWLELVPVNTITKDFDIHAVPFLFPPVGLTKDVRYQGVIQLGIGPSTSEVPIISLPVTFLSDTLVGHVPEKQIYTLPVPRRVPANTRVVVRAANSGSVALTYGPVKIRYIERPAPPPPAMIPRGGDGLTWVVA